MTESIRQLIATGYATFNTSNCGIAVVKVWKRGTELFNNRFCAKSLCVVTQWQAHLAHLEDVLKIRTVFVTYVVVL